MGDNHTRLERMYTEAVLGQGDGDIEEYLDRISATFSCCCKLVYFGGTVGHRFLLVRTYQGRVLTK